MKQHLKIGDIILLGDDRRIVKCRFCVLQVRKDLQILSARGDRLWRAVRDLQKGLEDLETEQGATQHRMNQILQRVKSLVEPSAGLQTQVDVDVLKVSKTKNVHAQVFSLDSNSPFS